MPFKPIWKNGQFLGTQYVPEAKPTAYKRPPGYPQFTDKGVVGPGQTSLAAVKQRNPGSNFGVAKAGGQEYLTDPYEEARFFSPGRPGVGLPGYIGAGGAGGAGARGAGSTTTTTGGGDPWEKYLRMLDERERAIYDREATLRQQRAKDLMESMAGFGGALQANAAEQWGNVIKAYGRAGDTATAYDQGLATSYGQGLTDANRQIAADFAAIHQGGDPTTLRDDAAALEQIRTEGGARPGETMGLVGRAWGSYGETRPGTIGFMTGQNIAQVARTAVQADEDAQVEMIKDLADNPQDAVQMWQTLQSYKDATTKAEADAAQQKFENQLALKKESREQQAWLETLAKTRTDQTGRLYVVRNGRIVPAGQVAPGSKAYTAAQSAATTRRGQNISATTQRRGQDITDARIRAQNRIANGLARSRIDISEGNLRVAQQAETRLQRGAKSKKNPQGYTPKQLQDWRGKARQQADFVATNADAHLAGNEKAVPYVSLGKDADGKAIPRPRDVVRAALTSGAPYTVIQQLIRNLAKTRYKSSDEWRYAAANW